MRFFWYIGLFCAFFAFSDAHASGLASPTGRAVQMVRPLKHPVRKARTVSLRPKQPHPLIILDAGHGGKDQGAKVEGTLEKRLCLTTALYLKRALEQLGHRVVLTRSRDVTLSLPRRVRIASKMEADLFVSVHYNSAPNAQASGVEVLYYPSKLDPLRTKESRQLANCVLYQVVDHTQMLARSVKERNLHVLRETEMPAIMVEGGFMTNPEELSNLRNREFIMKIAQGIARGIESYLRM